MLALAAWLLAGPGWALVRYDDGRRVIKGVQLLQDAGDPNVYFYVPQFPRLATRADGTFELLCLKYVDPTGAASGGLFHALIEFSLPDELVADVERELKKQVPGARLAGPVPLLQAAQDGEDTGDAQGIWRDMHVLQGALLQQFLIYFDFVGGAQVVRNFDKNNAVLQRFRLLVAYKGRVFMFIGVAYNHLVGVDHAKTPGLDVLFLAECKQHVQEFLICFEHFNKFHEAAIGDIEFTIEAIGAWVAFDADFTDG